MSLPTQRFNEAVDEMLTHLSSFLPPAALPDPPLPPRPSTLALLEAAERAVGVGNWQGNVEKGALAVLALRGGRVEARVRFELRANTPADAALRAGQLQDAVRAARLDPVANPWMRDFLVLEPAGGEPAHLLTVDDGWRQTVEYRALYEYRYEDPEGAASVIVRVRVALRGEQHEDAQVTRDVARWDREAALPLRLRGPRAAGPLTALLHDPGALPAGEVTLLRTHDGAPGAPQTLALAAFRDALLEGGRHHQVVFPSLAAFFAEFAGAGGSVRLARLDDSEAAFQALESGPLLAEALAAARLEGRGERLEVIYHDPGLAAGEEEKLPGGSLAVVYLRAGRGLAA